MSSSIHQDPFIEESLHSKYSDRLGQEMMNYVQYSEEKFAVLMSYFYDEYWLINQRVSWFITPLVEEKPDLLLPYLEDMIDHLPKAKHVSFVRNSMRMLQNFPIPEEYQGILYDYGQKLIQDIKEPVANKAFAMTMMMNIARDYPELQEELKMILETQMPFEKPAYKSRARKILKEIA